MDNSYKKLLEGNENWRNAKQRENASFFDDLARGQQPEFLWIGCSDSRVPANEITGMESGSIFVHRNIANLVMESDLNFLAVLTYAVEHLNVKHIIVCGHYGCGGVTAALKGVDSKTINTWIEPIEQVLQRNKNEIDLLETDDEKVNRLVELNVKQQVRTLAGMKLIREAWKKQELHLHGWVYGLKDGNIHTVDGVRSGVDNV